MIPSLVAAIKISHLHCPLCLLCPLKAVLLPQVWTSPQSQLQGTCLTHALKQERGPGQPRDSQGSN